LPGVLAREDATAVTLRLAGGREVTLARDQITKLERQNRSLMPEGIEAGLDHQGLADLLEFLVR
jgi:putative heme-binding domain-containing protein